MNRRGHRGKIDANQKAISAIAQAHGWQVVSLAGVGDGCPDLLLWKDSQGFRLVEVKTARGKFTPAQEKFRARYSMPVLTVRTEQEAADLLGPISSLS